MDTTITLYPASPADEDFLRRVYFSTREEELAPVPWEEAAKQAFLAMQFAAQHQHYHGYFPDADYLIVAIDGQPAGRLYVDRNEGEIRVVDIALLPEYRGRGIGTYLLESLLVEAQTAGKPVRLHVEPFNRALHLYERLGFRKIGEAGFYWLLEWSGSTGQTVEHCLILSPVPVQAHRDDE